MYVCMYVCTGILHLRLLFQEKRIVNKFFKERLFFDMHRGQWSIFQYYSISHLRLMFLVHCEIHTSNCNNIDTNHLPWSPYCLPPRFPLTPRAHSFSHSISNQIELPNNQKLSIHICFDRWGHEHGGSHGRPLRHPEEVPFVPRHASRKTCMLAEGNRIHKALGLLQKIILCGHKNINK